MKNEELLQRVLDRIVQDVVDGNDEAPLDLLEALPLELLTTFLDGEDFEPCTD
jgi:hypothetical protein